MNSNVDVRTVRKHEGGVDLPPSFEATIELGKPNEEDPNSQATLAEFRQLLTTAVNSLNIPQTASFTEGVTVRLKWS